MLPLVYHPNYSCAFPARHRFVMSKFRRLYDFAVEAGLVAADGSNILQPSPLRPEDLVICHDPHYLNALATNTVERAAWRRVGLPWSEGLIARTLTAPHGTLLAAEQALETGLACHLAGGTHHAHRDFGSGFCLVNDLAFAAKSLLAAGRVQRVLIFDCDVHQGDGTAAMLRDTPDVFTCSIHCEKNFPFRKHESDWDIGLPVAMGDDAYLQVVAESLALLLTRLQPDLVLYDAGVDVWEDDPLGKLRLSWDGIMQRDLEVLRLCADRGVPVATVIGGGYDKDHGRLARRHGIVLQAAARVAAEMTL